MSDHEKLNLKKISECGLVHVHALPQSQYAVSGIQQDVAVLVTITTKKIPVTENASRNPIELMVVLDRSGSMSGSKLTKAKEALTMVIEKLGENDRLGVVVYDHNVDVLFESTQIKDSRKKLKKFVSDIKVGGSTNISSALEKACGMFTNKEFTRYIMLLSDGEANCGKCQTTAELMKLAGDLSEKHDSAIHSFGIGSGFNEETMAGMAESGNGNFFFCDEAEKTSAFISAVLNGALNTIGRKALLKVRGKNGAVVKKCYLGDQFIKDGVPLNSIVAENTKSVLFLLSVPTSGNDGDKFEIASFELSYDDAQLPPYEKAKPVVVKIKGLVSVLLTENDDLVKEHENADVQVALHVQKTAEEEEEIRQDLMKGRVEEAKKKKAGVVKRHEAMSKIDKTGRVALMAKKGKKHMHDLEVNGASETNVKQAQYNAIQSRQDDMAQQYADFAFY